MLTFGSGQNALLQCVDILELLGIESLELALQGGLDAGQVLQCWARHGDSRNQKRKKDYDVRLCT